MKTQLPVHFNAWLALAGSIALGAFAQIALKLAANQKINPEPQSRTVLTWRLTWFGLFVAATYLWLRAIGELDISYAYPLLGLGYLVVTGLAAWILGERVTRTRWLAVLLIAAGAACVAGSV